MRRGLVDHSDDDIANNPHSTFRHELRGHPSGDEADQQNDGKALIGQMHAVLHRVLFTLSGAHLKRKTARRYIRARAASWRRVLITLA